MISTVLGIVRFPISTKLPKFLDIVLFFFEIFAEKWTCPNISTTWGLALVEQNAKKPGPSGQKFSKPPLKGVDEALELLSDEE